jgi:hypothetical protein
MGAMSCSLYFFANDGISSFIPLWIRRARSLLTAALERTLAF